MKRIIRALLLVILGIILLIAGILVHAGLFTRVEISEKQMGPYQTVYKPHTGAYHKISSVIDEISETLVLDDRLETSLSFGHYFDNPFEGSTKIKDLKSHAGIIIDPSDTAELSALIMQHDFHSEMVPIGTYLVVELPFRSEFSKITGPLKVYSKINKYLNKEDFKMQSLIEIFDYQNSRLLYISPIPVN